MEPAPPPPPSSPAPPPRAALTLFVGLALAFPLVGGAVQSLNLPLGLLWTEAFLFFSPAVLLAGLYGGRPLAWLGLQRPRLASVGWGLALGLANYPLAGALEALVRQAVPPWVAKAFDLGSALGGPAGWQRVALIAAVGLAAPLGEEALFRGLIQRSLLGAMAPARAIGLCALLFAAIHYEPIGLLARLELGLLFGVLAYRTGTLWSAVAAHAASNLFALALYFAAHDPAEGAAPLGQLALLGGVGLGLTGPMLLVMHRTLPRAPRSASPWTPPSGVARRAARLGMAALLTGAAIATFAVCTRPHR